MKKKTTFESLNDFTLMFIQKKKKKNVTNLEKDELNGDF